MSEFAQLASSQQVASLCVLALNKGNSMRLGLFTRGVAATAAAVLVNASAFAQSATTPIQILGAELQAWFDADGFAAAGINLSNGCYFMSKGSGSGRAQSIHCATRPPFTVIGESRVVGNQICSKNSYPDGSTVAHCQDVFRIGDNKYEMRVDDRPMTLMYRLVR